MPNVPGFSNQRKYVSDNASEHFDCPTLGGNMYSSGTDINQPLTGTEGGRGGEERQTEGKRRRVD
jgi:hypothetical protein